MASTTHTKVALVTADEIPELDDEGRQVQAQLAALGVRATPAVWDDPDVAWGEFDLAVLRSTWDYQHRPDEFLAWVDRVAAATVLCNPAPVVHWNHDKRYLDALAAAGVPVIETLFLAPGTDREHALLDVDHVVKPSVSAGAQDTLRFSPADRSASIDHVRSIHRSGRTAMVQPYVQRVDDEHESALVFVDGEFAHAAAKAAMLSDAGRPAGTERMRATTATDEQLAVAAQALAAVPVAEPLLYARVDLVPSEDGPLVLELELIEPSLFLSFDGSTSAETSSTRRFAEAICRRAVSD